MPTPILATKFFIPLPHAGVVRRPRLLQNFAAETDRKLTLISAPAGFGKTTLASYWLTGLDKTIAWVSLDENDNDSIRFLIYILSALNQVDSDVGKTALDSLQSPDPLSNETLLIHLINDLAGTSHQYILTLDDYHLIENQAIHDALTFLLDNLPPQLEIAIISRTEPPLPIARLRSQNQLVELHAADLRFTWAETEKFLNQVMCLGLRGDQITQLVTQTEGWITGLQLTALNVKNSGDAVTLINNLSGSDRYIADYLVDEVLSRQSEPIRRFLLQTSVLTRMCADLCNTVLDIENSQSLLESLETANLFVIPLDGHRQWYRYHHLFAEMLRTRLERENADIVPGLFRRAFEWHQVNDFPETAIRYAIAAGEYERAADIVEEVGQDVYWRNRQDTVRKWLRALPDELLQTRPHLRILHAYSVINQGDLRGVELAVQNLRNDLAVRPLQDEAGFRVLQGKLAAIGTAVAFHRHMDYAETVRLAEQALEFLPTEYNYDRCVASFHGGGGRIMLGELDAARTDLNRALLLSDRANSLPARLLTLTNLGHLEIVSGSLSQAQIYYRQAYDAAQRTTIRQASPFSGVIIGLAGLHYERNELETASAYLEEGIRLVERDEFFDRIVFAYMIQMRLACTQRDYATARSILTRARERIMRYGAPPKVNNEVDFLAACLAVTEGDRVKVSDWERRFRERFDGHVTFEEESALILLAGILMKRGDYAGAADHLHKLLSLAQQQGRMRSVIMLRIQLASVSYLKRDLPIAQDYLRQALALAEQEQYVRTFVDAGPPVRSLLMQLGREKQVGREMGFSPAYVQLLLDNFAVEPASKAGAGKSLTDLTPREAEVLEYLAGGMSYADIAASMVITENTLKYHVKNIYSKLGVKNRMQAVVSAQGLGLL